MPTGMTISGSDKRLEPLRLMQQLMNGFCQNEIRETWLLRQFSIITFLFKALAFDNSEFPTPKANTPEGIALKKRKTVEYNKGKGNMFKIPGGYARYNWWISVGGTGAGVPAKGSRVAPPPAKGQADIEKLRKVLSLKNLGVKDTQRSLKAVREEQYRPILALITVYNNVRYIDYLEHGHSAQAPNGFAWKALMATRAYIMQRGW